MIILPFPPSGLSGRAKGQKNRRWSDEEMAWLRAAYDGSNSAVVAEALGRSRAAVKNQACKMGLTVQPREWTEAEIAILRDAYSKATLRGDLKGLTERLGRDKASISSMAGKLGLTSRTRPVLNSSQPKKPRSRKYDNAEDRRVALVARMVEQHRVTPHPMKGKTHSTEAKVKISANSIAAWASKTETEKAAWTEKRLKSKLAKHGTLAPPRHGTTWKSGWREIGGKRTYYRSRWEANYARYLEWLKNRGEISDWAHEPETFWFENIKRGVRSYLPDFRVFERDGSSKLHEVKGWMDSRSRTTLRRMAKYYPAETVIVIREREYNAIARQVGRMIEGWESSNRSDRP